MPFDNDGNIICKQCGFNAGQPPDGWYILVEQHAKTEHPSNYKIARVLFAKEISSYQKAKT